MQTPQQEFSQENFAMESRSAKGLPRGVPFSLDTSYEAAKENMVHYMNVNGKIPMTKTQIINIFVYFFPIFVDR